jgi:hypothetical protein
MIVRPAAITPRLRMSSFWIWHVLTPLLPLFQPPLEFQQRIHMRIEILFRAIAFAAIPVRPAMRT